MGELGGWDWNCCDSDDNLEELPSQEWKLKQKEVSESLEHETFSSEALKELEQDSGVYLYEKKEDLNERVAQD